MRTVTVRYHQEPEGWWAETDELPTFSAAGASYEEVRERVRDALPDLLGESLELLEDDRSRGRCATDCSCSEDDPRQRNLGSYFSGSAWVLRDPWAGVCERRSDRPSASRSEYERTTGACVGGSKYSAVRRG